MFSKQIEIPYNATAEDCYSDPFEVFGMDFKIRLTKKEEKIGIYFSRAILKNFPEFVKITCEIDSFEGVFNKKGDIKFGTGDKDIGWPEAFDINDFSKHIANNGKFVVRVNLNVSEWGKERIDFYLKNKDIFEKMSSEFYLKYKNTLDTITQKSFDSLIVPHVQTQPQPADNGWLAHLKRAFSDGILSGALIGMDKRLWANYNTMLKSEEAKTIAHVWEGLLNSKILSFQFADIEFRVVNAIPSDGMIMAVAVSGGFSICMCRSKKAIVSSVGPTEHIYKESGLTMNAADYFKLLDF